MSTIGERRHAESSHEAPPEKKSKSEYHSPSLKSKLEELKARTTAMMESQRGSQLQQFKQDFEYLTQAIVALQETMEKMQKTIEEGGDEIQDLRKENEELRKEVRALKKKVEELENKLSTYNVDECFSVTNIFEMAICWHVMPEVYHGDKLTSRIQGLHDYVNDITNIEDWAGMTDENKKAQCRQRWEEVCKKLEWPMNWE